MAFGKLHQVVCQVKDLNRAACFLFIKMKLICTLTDCPIPCTYFSLLGLLALVFYSFCVKLFEQQVIFTGPLYLLLAYPTHVYFII